MQGKAKIVNGHSRNNSLPNFLNSIVTPIITTPEIKTEYIEDVKPPPPLYEEATKQINKKNSIKSQIVDDVLEILIKNGELPPSAAQDPITPNSAGTKGAEPIFPHQNHTSHNVDISSTDVTLGLDPTEILDTLDNLDNMDFTQFAMELGEGNPQHCENNNLHNDHDEMSIPMDTDDWLESLCIENGQNSNNLSCTAPLASQESDLVAYDPLLSIVEEPFDPFNLEEFQSPADLTAALSWDKVDYAA